MPTLHATWLDIVELVPQLWDREAGNFTTKTRAQILAYIQAASSITEAELRPYYSSLNALAPWYKIPASDAGNSNKDSFLAPSLTLGANTVTQVITVTFTSTTAFNVVGDVSGTLASGTTGSDYTVAGLITIPKAAWTGTINQGDKFYISTYLTDPSVVSSIVAPLATANLLDSVYTDQVPNSVDTSTKFRDISRNMVKALKTHNVRLEQTPIEIDLTPEQQSYYIDLQGNDQTEYNDSYSSPY